MLTLSSSKPVVEILNGKQDLKGHVVKFIYKCLSSFEAGRPVYVVHFYFNTQHLMDVGLEKPVLLWSKDKGFTDAGRAELGVKK